MSADTHVVVVRWRDARGVSPQWQPLEEITDGLCEIVSVGRMLPSDDPEVIVIAPHWSLDEDPDACGVMYIPRGCVVQMDAISLPEERHEHR